jgi:hypothetical protein
LAASRYLFFYLLEVKQIIIIIGEEAVRENAPISGPLFFCPALRM